MSVKLADVFGIRTEPLRSYTERTGVDGKFTEALASDHHIIVYGSSKQGKTALRQTHLAEKDCVIIRCGPNNTVETIYTSLVRQLEVRIETFESRKDTIGSKVETKIGFKAILPFFGGGHADVGADLQGKVETQSHTEFISYDFGEAQSIGELLQHAVLESASFLKISTTFPPMSSVSFLTI